MLILLGIVLTTSACPAYYSGYYGDDYLTSGWYGSSYGGYYGDYDYRDRCDRYIDRNRGDRHRGDRNYGDRHWGDKNRDDRNHRDNRDPGDGDRDRDRGERDHVKYEAGNHRDAYKR